MVVVWEQRELALNIVGLAVKMFAGSTSYSGPCTSWPVAQRSKARREVPRYHHDDRGEVGCCAGSDGGCAWTRASGKGVAIR